MPADQGLDFPALISTSAITTIAAGATWTSDIIDLGATTTVVPGEIGVEPSLVFGAGTPDGNQQAIIKLLWSHDGTLFSDADLARAIYQFDVVASAIDVDPLAFPVYARWVRFLIDNDQVAGPDITSSSTIKYNKIFGDIA